MIIIFDMTIEMREFDSIWVPFNNIRIFWNEFVEIISPISEIFVEFSFYIIKCNLLKKRKGEHSC